MYRKFIVYAFLFTASGPTFAQSCLDNLQGKNVTAQLQCLAESLKNNIAIPKGAVVAFDRSPDRLCPEGWTVWRAATSRVIIGAGNTSDSYEQKLKFDENGKELTPRAYRQHGGAETEILTIPQLPKHNHGGATGSKAIFEPLKGGNVAGKFGSRDHVIGVSRHTHVINGEGGNQAHNNMPPFVALYYCKKE